MQEVEGRGSVWSLPWLVTATQDRFNKLKHNSLLWSLPNNIQNQPGQEQPQRDVEEGLEEPQ